MGILKRTIAFALALILPASVCLSITSCGKAKRTVKTVPDTDPWYESTEVELDPMVNPEDYQSFTPFGPYMCNDKYVMLYDEYIRSKDETECLVTSAKRMGIFDQDGSLLHMVDLDEIMSVFTAPWNVFMPTLCCGSEKGIRYYFRDSFTGLYCCDIDPDTGLVTGTPEQIDLGQLDTEDMIVNLYVIEDYELVIIENFSSARTKIVVLKDGNVLYTLDSEKELGPGVLSYISKVFGTGDGAAVITGSGKSFYAGKLELATGKLTELADERLNVYPLITNALDGAAYLTRSSGIYKFEPENTGEEIKLNYDFCDINRFVSSVTSVLYYDENKIILSYSGDSTKVFSMPSPPVIYTLEKAEKNPNAGKKILTVASLTGYLSYFEAEALKSFNEQNSEYFAVPVFYGEDTFFSFKDPSAGVDEIDINRYSAMAMTSGNLITDIRSGTGPDIILGAAESVDLLDSSYLEDLTSYIESKDFDPSAYYSNIIDASKTDGKTYYIPTAFTVTGIVTDGSKLGGNVSGLTYEQYASFVKEQLNGVEPVTRSSSRMHFFNLCIQRDYQDWIKNNKIDFNNDGFLELAGFFKEYIPEGNTSGTKGEELSSIVFVGGSKNGFRNNIFKTAGKQTLDQKEGFTDGIMLQEDGEPDSGNLINTSNSRPDAVFLEDLYDLITLAHSNYYGDNIRMIGLPSKDGTGPSAKIGNSFSITAGTPLEKAAYEFLDILLSENIQKELKMQAAIPINRAAVLKKIEKEKASNLAAYNIYKNYPPEYGYSLKDLCLSSGVFCPDSKLPDIFLGTLENIDSVLIPDNSVLMIVSEEIPPYLIDQKDIGSVISVINSRSQTVFDER